MGVAAMSELITKLDESNFEAEVLNSELPVLVDCWAAWCRPCMAMNPILESAAEQGANTLRVAKLNVEAHKPLSEKLNVGSLPTFMIFRNGSEVARKSGSMSASKLREWLAANGVGGVPVSEPVEREAAAWSAFYGDAELRDFLFNRLKVLARSGSIRPYRFATWSGEDGNPSGCLVHSDKPQVFENLIGAPYSFACAMDLCEFVSISDIEQLHDAIKAGSNLEHVATAVVREWLIDPTIDWASDLDGDPVGPVKGRWVEMAAKLLGGSPPSPAEWAKLREELTAAKSSDRDPYRGNADSVATMLIKLSPPASGDGAIDAWGSALMLNAKSILARLGWRRAGWTREDIAQEGLFYRWATARDAEAPGGALPDEERFKLGAEWRRDHQSPGYDEKKAEFAKNGHTYVEPMLVRLRSHLIKALEAAPR
jgi:thioredoxin 1